MRYIKENLIKKSEQSQSNDISTQQKKPTQTQIPTKTEDYRNGFFIGIGIGAMGSKFGGNQADFEATYAAPNVRLGYQKFNANHNILGSRIYIDYAYGIPAKGSNQYADIGYSETIESDQGYLALNLDLLLDIKFPNTTNTYAGLILGVGYGRINHNSTLSWIQEGFFSTETGRETQTLGMMTPFINLGVSITHKKHKLEVYSKLPTSTKYTEKFYYEVSAPLVSLVYQYTF